MYPPVAPPLRAYSNILYTGCTTHCGSLLFKDVCLHTWVEGIIDKAVLVAKFFRNHQYYVTEVHTRTHQQHRTYMSVLMYGPARFASMYFVMNRLLFLRTILKEIAVSQGFEERNFSDADTITGILDSVPFWRDMEKLCLFLKPLKCFIRLMDHDCHCTHHEYNGACSCLRLVRNLNLPCPLSGMWLVGEHWAQNEAGVPSPFKKFAVKKHKERWAYMTFSIHHIAYALSPHHHDEYVFSMRAVMAGFKEVLRFFTPTPQAYQDALVDAQWPVLQLVALRIFSVGTSSSTSERNFR